MYKLYGAIVIIVALVAVPIMTPMIVPKVFHEVIVYVPLYGELLGYRLKGIGMSRLAECTTMAPSKDRDEKYDYAMRVLERAKSSYIAQMKMFPNVERLESNLIEVQKMRFMVGKRQTL